MSVLDVFRQHVVATPDVVAVKEQDPAKTLTYAQLDERSDRVSRWLRRRELPPETLVGVFADRSGLTIIAFLGILKANLAYLPFDVRTPKGRMETIFSTFGGEKLVLVGEDVTLPLVELDGVKFVPIRNVLRDSANQYCPTSHSTQPKEQPSPSSLAYVLFTSGSTGRPKGVMIEHRGIVRLVKDCNMIQYLPSSPIVAHIGSIAFDASTWEIYASLLNGGTLVCVDTKAMMKPETRHQMITQNGVQAALFTPALLKQCLVDSPSTFSTLETLVIGGDCADPLDLDMVRKEMRSSKLLNAYGPTETTVASTIYCIPEEEVHVDSVPIGRTISNSAAYVMDEQQQLVPLGVTGEIVVTGDGVARGYTEEEQNTDRFIVVTIKGKQLQAYRTGDYARYRPKDGQLEYLGRIDGQIKIRGQRIELGEIEHALGMHASVNEIAVLLLDPKGHNPHLTAFITMSDRAEKEVELNNSPDANHTNTWTELFDKDTYTSIDKLDQSDLGKDFTGWTSMYDGKEINKSKMREWLTDAISGIIEDGDLGNVLEVGSGSGMMLFNLGEDLQSYTGIEPSKEAINFIMTAAHDIPTLAGKVRMISGTAADISEIQGGLATLPDTVIINSVVQYFPSQAYLFQALEHLVQFGSARSIYIGDIRSYALYRQFLASRAIHFTQEMKTTLSEIERVMDDMAKAEKELLVDPAFFTGLQDRLPSIEHVEILPKRMQTTNELSSYRYAVRIHLNVKSRQPLQVQEPPSAHWIDFEKEGLDHKSLLDLLRQVPKSSKGLAVANIPHEKTLLERSIVEVQAGHRETSDGDWLASIQDQVQNRPSLSSMQIDEIAQEAGFHAAVSWARQNSQRGGLDTVFYRMDKNTDSRPLFRFPTDHQSLPNGSLANRPTWHQVTQSVREEVLELLKTQLPSYMVPQTLHVLDQMPINQNGKVDHHALASLARIPQVKGKTTRQPGSDRERQMQAIWARTLQLKNEDIGLDDNFFGLGGDSMVAMKLVGEARKAGIELAVADIFRLNTLEQLANMSARRALPSASDDEDAMLVQPSAKDALLAELDDLDLGINSAAVADILPSTSTQEGYLCDDLQFRLCCIYFYLDLGTRIDLAHLEKSCMSLLEQVPILRTCFLRLQGHLWQVVLGRFAVDMQVGDAAEASLDESCHQTCFEDWQSIRSTQLPTSFMLVRHKTQGNRLVLRLQHAQYDGVSMPIILQSLLDLYDGKQPRQGPSFSRFLSCASRQRDRSLAYWKQLLAGSASTILEGRLGEVSASDTEMVATDAETELPLPKVLGGRITSATIVSAAWAVLLYRLTGETDIVYGHKVAGRNSAIDGIEDIAAPCLNIIPVRTRLALTQTPAELFHSVQEQALAMGEADSMGYKDIIQNATTWAGGLDFGTVMQHQNLDEQPQLNYAGDDTKQTRAQCFQNPRFMWRSIMMVSYPRNGRLLLRLGANSYIMSAPTAQKLMNGLGEIIERLCGSMKTPLGSWMDAFELDLTG